MDSEDYRNNGGIGNKSDNARLDISAIGVWGPFEKSYFDVRVVHVNAPSYISKSIEQVYKQHENEKKSQYNNRVLQVEKGSFIPNLVMSTSGGMAKEATRHHKRVGELISSRRDARYTDIMRYIRTRLRFALLRTVLASVRGVRGKRSDRGAASIANTSFNMIPHSNQYESP